MNRVVEFIIRMKDEATNRLRGVKKELSDSQRQVAETAKAEGVAVKGSYVEKLRATEAAKKLADEKRKLAADQEKAAKSAESGINALQGVRAASSAATGSLSGMRGVLMSLTKAFPALQAAMGPIGWVIAAITALGAGIKYAFTWTDNLNKKLRDEAYRITADGIDKLSGAYRRLAGDIESAIKKRKQFDEIESRKKAADHSKGMAAMDLEMQKSLGNAVTDEEREQIERDFRRRKEKAQNEFEAQGLRDDLRRLESDADEAIQKLNKAAEAKRLYKKMLDDAQMGERTAYDTKASEEEKGRWKSQVDAARAGLAAAKADIEAARADLRNIEAARGTTDTKIEENKLRQMTADEAIARENEKLERNAWDRYEKELEKWEADEQRRIENESEAIRKQLEDRRRLQEAYDREAHQCRIEDIKAEAKAWAHAQSAASDRLSRAKNASAQAWAWYRDPEAFARQRQEERDEVEAQKRFIKDEERLKRMHDWRARELTDEQEAVRRVVFAREEERAAKAALSEIAENTAKTNEMLEELLTLKDG